METFYHQIAVWNGHSEGAKSLNKTGMIYKVYILH